ncbi:MAG: outer membrane lipoprotein-sorting protein [Deltaproteobacteria bacterium]|nr:outer membrane lipoprotein-sorting protein [Deltaproteobacteria bacterium]
MKQMMVFAFVASFFLTLPEVSLAGDGAVMPSVKEIVDKAVAKSKALDKMRLGYTVIQHVTVEKLDDGEVEEKDELLIKVVPVGKTRYGRVVKKNGKPLAGDDLEKEQEREKEFREAIAKGETPKEQKHGKFVFDEDFVAKYNFTLKGKIEVNGRPAYVLAFKPKSKNLPEKKEADRFLNKTRGTLWIDCEEYVIAKASSRLMEPIKILGGIVASIKKFEFTMTQKKVGDLWFPTRVHQKIAGRKLVSSFDTRIDVRFDPFKKIAH